jgi:hypothetical protein
MKTVKYSILNILETELMYLSDECGDGCNYMVDFFMEELGIE